MHQGGCLGEDCFKGFECLGLVRAPDEWGVLVGEVNQGDNDVGEPNNESAIEVSETQEHLDCVEVRQGQPDADSIGLGSVHGDSSGGDHEA